MRAVLSVLFWSYMALSSTTLFLGALLVWAVTLPFDRTKRLLHLYSSAWAWHYIVLWPWWKVTITGREHLPDGPAVLAPNHQSFADILVLYGLFHHFKWVSKDLIFKVPVVGWNMRLNQYVQIKRGDASSAKAMMDHCRSHLEDGSSVMIFPEGTRSVDGALRPFKHGAFTLATDVNVPVVPIAVVGTSTVLPKSGWVLRGASVDARVHVLPPLHPADFDGDRDRLMQAVADAIQAAQEDIRASMGTPSA